MITMSLANAIARNIARVRKSIGTKVLWNGKTYLVSVKTDESSPDFLPDNGQNAAAADPKIYGFTPADLTTHGVLLMPKPGDTLTVGTDHRIVSRVTPDYASGIPLSVRVWNYRQIATDRTLADPDAAQIAALPRVGS